MMLPRRVFVIAAVGGLLGTRRSTSAQQTEMAARVGILLTASPSDPRSLPEIDAFMRELRRLGWVEAQNLAVERRSTERPESFPALAADLIRSNVAVILTPGPVATRAARQATSTISIVMVAATDPRQVGVASLARPSGNLTGLTIGEPRVVNEKRLELLKAAVPRLSRVTVLWDVPRSEGAGEGEKSLAAAARALGLRLQHLEINRPTDFERGFKVATQQGAGAVFLIESPRAVANRALVAELGLRNRLPVMSQFRAIVEAGGLMSYGPDLPDLFGRAAAYVDRILRGAKPSDLPIEQPTKFELVINARTANALGLAIPRSLLVRADEVIE
jgi:putative ABC transport system substrate-binding protein